MENRTPMDQETRLRIMEEKVDKHENILRGEDGMSGLLASTIRLQEQMKNQTRLLYWMLGGIGALLVEAVISWVKA